MQELFLVRVHGVLGANGGFNVTLKWRMQTWGVSFSVFSSENSFLLWGPSPTTELSCFSQCLDVLKMLTVFPWNRKKRKEQKKELLCLFLVFIMVGGGCQYLYF